MENLILKDFIKETCSDSPTPGGGSVAALMASLSVSLAAMSANLTINKKGYEDVQGYCKVASIDEIKEHDYILTPGRYVGIEEVEDDGEPFEEKMERLTNTLSNQFKKSRELEEEIRKQLGGIGYEL